LTFASRAGRLRVVAVEHARRGGDVVAADVAVTAARGFLGRHTVYKQVEGGATAEADDIPF
jgi:hypothetical protein